MTGLMALVGHLLMRWGWLENVLEGRPVPSELSGVREMRNIICHGLEGATADPTSETPPHVRCRTRDGTTIRYTAQELTEAIEVLERARLTAR